MALELNDLDEQLGAVYDDIPRMSSQRKKGKGVKNTVTRMMKRVCQANPANIQSGVRSWKFPRIMWAVVIGDLPQKANN